MSKELILEKLNENPDLSSNDIAKQLNISEYEVLQNMPEDKAKAIDGSNFDKVIQDLSTWGKILMIKITPSFVIEIKDHMPLGEYGHGYYNFNSDNTSISGHLKVSDIDKIIFISKKMRGRLSHNITFFDKEGEHIFKVFITRDENGELLENQLNAFMDLKNSL